MKRLAGLLLFLLLYAVPVQALENECENCKNEPPCCVAMHSSHDPFECSWPIRGYCKLSTCALIEGDKQKCGWYWVFHDANGNEYHLGTNSPAGYGCMIGETKETMRPRCEEPTPMPTVKPTVLPPTPIPTQIPTLRPSPLPTAFPTYYVPPPQTLPTQTTVPFEFPTSAPSISIVAELPDLHIPEYTDCAKPSVLVEQTRRLYASLKTADSLLEDMVRAQLDRFAAFLRTTLNGGS